MTLAIETEGLGKRYGHQPALIDCNLQIPVGRVLGLVGPNGAGKSTLLGLTSGLIEPTSGTITVLGSRPAASAEQLARVGFVAQDTPLYAGLSVGDHLRLGAKLNPRWDRQLARQRIEQVGLGMDQKAGRLSGGQRAQLALTIAAAKRPELLIFDEPVAALDPLARRAFLQSLMEFVAEIEATVVLSSHLISDLERVCDHLVILADGRVQLAGEVEDLLANHYRLVGARSDFENLPDSVEVILAEHTGRQSTLTVRSAKPLPYPPTLTQRLDLEDMVLAYMHRAANGTGTPPNRPAAGTPQLTPFPARATRPGQREPGTHRRPAAPWEPPAGTYRRYLAFMASMRLFGRMSVQDFSMYSRQSSRGASPKTVVQPSGTATKTGHSECWPSSLTRTR